MANGFSQQPEHFERGNIEYRRAEDTSDLYEYNRIHAPGSVRFADGGIADGYVRLNADGTPASPALSYVVLDQYIKRDAPELGELAGISLASRDFSYYSRAEEALRSLERVRVSPDQRRVRVLSLGTLYEIELIAPYAVVDRSYREFFALVDVRAGMRLYADVELKVDRESHRALLVDRRSGTVAAELPYVHLVDVESGEELGPASRERSEVQEILKSASPASVEKPPSQALVAKAQATGESERPPRPASSGGFLGKDIAPKSVVTEEREGAPRLISETRREESTERIFELPQSKVRLALVYRADGSVTLMSVQAGLSLYPGGALVPTWEQQIARARERWKKFRYDDKETDIETAKRTVVSRARELLAYARAAAAFPDGSPESKALDEARGKLKADTEARYGKVFKA
jgi:hypothetical protein